MTSSSASRREGVTTPGGLINTSNVDDLLRSYVASARLETDFDRLPIPYRAVATDMVTGSMVVLDQGDLATAMRASMAIPGAFAPVLMDDKILSDGGLVRNIPVDVARELCADVVIVVNLVEPAADPNEAAERDAAPEPHDGRHDRSQRDVAAADDPTHGRAHQRRDGLDHHGRLRARSRDDTARRGCNARDVGRARSVSPFPKRNILPGATR